MNFEKSKKRKCLGNIAPMNYFHCTGCESDKNNYHNLNVEQQKELNKSKNGKGCY